MLNDTPAHEKAQAVEVAEASATPAAVHGATACEPAAAVVSTWGDGEVRDSTLTDSKFSQSSFDADRRAHRSGLRNLLASNFLVAGHTSIETYLTGGTAQSPLQSRPTLGQFTVVRPITGVAKVIIA